MRGAITVTGQTLGAAAALAAIGALVGFLIAHFATSKSAVTGVGWGMVIAGACAGLVVGRSGSPSRDLVRGRRVVGGRFAGAALPESPLQVALGGVLTFGAGIGLLVLTYSGWMKVVVAGAGAIGPLLAGG